jgi:hypothetical protein
MDGMVTKVDQANSQIFLIYKSGGEPDEAVARRRRGHPDAK